MVKKTGGHDNERNVFYNSRMQPLLRKRLHGKRHEGQASQGAGQ